MERGERDEGRTHPVSSMLSEVAFKETVGTRCHILGPAERAGDVRLKEDFTLRHITSCL